MSVPEHAERALVAAASPVRAIPGDEPGGPRPGIALCLSGGGYRAMLFHLGALWRLNELGYLPRLDRVSSVSGGSITAGALGAAGNGSSSTPTASRPASWRRSPSRYASWPAKTVDKPAILRGALLPGTSSDRVAGAYQRHLLGDATLQDLPDQPRFVINATNLQSGVLWRFSKPYMADYRVGKVEPPTESLADAVAASSAFPPVLSPLEPDARPGPLRARERPRLQRPEYREAHAHRRRRLRQPRARDGLEALPHGPRQRRRRATARTPNVPSDWARQLRRVLA